MFGSIALCLSALLFYLGGFFYWSVPAKLDQAGEIKGCLVEAAAHQLEAAGFCGAHNAVFLKGVSPGGFAGAWEQLADALQQRQQRRVGSKAHDQSLFGEAAEVLHHLLSRLLGVMDEHIQAADGVERAAQAFQVAGEEVQLSHVEARFAGAAFGFAGHRF